MILTVNYMNMKYKESVKQKNEINDKAFAIPQRNILYIIAGVVVMVLGYILMVGGGSDNPQEFNDAMFSFRRTVLAPVVILAGMVIEVVAIMCVGKKDRE